MEDPPEDIQMNLSPMLATPDPTAGPSAATRTTGKRKRNQPDLPEDEPEASSSRCQALRVFSINTQSSDKASINKLLIFYSY